MSPQIEKQQFRNDAGGYIGVVVLSVKGEERGIPVAPGETVWLSEAEQILTANAPRRAEDNPFIAQTVIRRNPETDAEEEVQVTPLVPVSENRYVPANERPIPSDLDTAAAAAADAKADQPTVSIGSHVLDNPISREAQVKAAAEDGQPVSPGTLPRPGAAAAAAHAAEQAEATPEPPEAPSEPEEPSQPVEEPLPTPPAPAAPLPPAADRSLQVPEDEGRVPQAPVEEETAAVSPGPEAEETGAALSPSGDAPVGEYQAGEEVGTPEAPATTPPPFTEE